MTRRLVDPRLQKIQKTEVEKRALDSAACGLVVEVLSDPRDSDEIEDSAYAADAKPSRLT